MTTNCALAWALVMQYEERDEIIVESTAKGPGDPVLNPNISEGLKSYPCGYWLDDDCVHIKNYLGERHE